MNKPEVKKRIAKLREVINRHRYLQHVLDRQEISENALDSLKKELFDLEQQFPEFITSDSPTQRVAGKPLDEFEKLQHSRPMLSLQDAFSQQDMFDWEERIKKLLSEEEKKRLDYFVEPKIDGLAVTLIYRTGIFVRGATRGDGRVGEDVTQNLKTIESIPLLLEKKIDCEVRGEVYITKHDFEQLNKVRLKAGEEPYANPRNTAAGSVRQLDPNIAAVRQLNFLAWQLLDRETQEQEFRDLKELGFKPAEGKYCQDLPAVFNYYQKVRADRDRFPFQLDGVVVSVNNNKLFDKLGVAGKAPRGAIAFKFPLKEAQTIVEDIIAQVGRTGAITPVAILKPVSISGVTITRATLHNEDEIKRLGIKIGDTVVIGRAGDVIPQVVKVLKEMRDGREKPFHLPSKCSICLTTLFKKEGEAVWRCPNTKCEGRQRRQLHHFVARNAFDIEGLGPKIINQLLDEGLISDAADLFALQEGDLIPLERFAEKSAANLIQAITNRKKISLARFIFALGIQGVGEETSVLIAQRLKINPTRQLAGGGEKLRIKEVLEYYQTLSLEEWQEIKDIGPVVSQSIYDWFRQKQNIHFLEKLDKAGIKVQLQTLNSKSQKLQGKIFVLTGSLKSMPRETAKEKIRQLGGDVSESVSQNTDLVVVGENPGSKFDQAKKLGMKTITEDEFLTMMQS